MNTLIESLNGWGGRFAGIALPMLLQSAVLILLLFALDLALRKKVRATIRYAVWMLALVKLALPPSLASPTGAAYWLPAETTQSYSTTIPASAPLEHEMSVNPIYSVAGSSHGFTLHQPIPVLTRPAVFFVCWLVVAAGMAIWMVCRLRIVIGVVRQSIEAPEKVRALLESCRRQLGIKRVIPVRCAAIGSPAISGIFRPVILIPPGLAEDLGGSEMRSVLLHELAHYKRDDLWVNHAQILLQILYWYNPLVWLANASIRRAREQAVDEMVLVKMGKGAPAYPATLLHVAKLGLGRPRAAIGFVGILEPGRGLTQRILHIINRPLPSTERIGARGLASVLLLALIALPMACRPKAEIPHAVLSKQAQPIVSIKDALNIRISKDGTMTLQNEPVRLDDLQKKIEEAVHENPQEGMAIWIEDGKSVDLGNKVNQIASAAGVAWTVMPMTPKRAGMTAEPPSDWSGKQLRGPGYMPSPRMLTPADADALEAKLLDDPEDFSARRDLLVYYGFRDRGAKEKHVLWIIEHHPEFSASGPEMRLDPVMEGSAYERGKTLWLKNAQENPTNALILRNAAAYFMIYDHATAEDLLKKAQALEPQNPAASAQLGQLYKLEAMGQPGELAAKALAEFEKAQAQSSPAVPGSPGLSDLAKMALDAGDLEKARKYANELLGPGMEWAGGGNAGDAFFQGNIVLGRIALRESKMDEAKKYLLEAGKTKGSPVLGSFGPNMMLAKELLEKGETNVVLEFFQECEKFWPQYGGQNKMAKWTAEVKEGKKPDFGANLLY
jgi:beta-lactamase regulating signal transducer with metallopeptidase domain/tetratricopeptide (TPR) repeat protein